MSKHGTAYTFGQYNEVHVALTKALPKALTGTDPKKVITVVKNGEALEQALSGVFRSLLDGKAPGNLYLLTVDYGMKVEEAVNRGHYDYVNSSITSQNFSTKQKGKVELVVELIHFDHSISSAEVLKELDRMGYRAADLHELLALGENYPDVQREFPVVALGSVRRSPHGDGRVVPYLWRHAAYRYAYLAWCGPDWLRTLRFAACRK